MTTTSLKMNRKFIAFFFLTIIAILLISSCKKNDFPHGKGNGPDAYSAEVLDKWISMQLRLMKNASGIQNQAFSRHYSYSGITALESLAPGLSAHSNVYRRWNGLTGLPVSNHSIHYYYPANVNAAMAAINKALFPNASTADKSAIDSLEAALNEIFLTKETPARITKSAEFGKAVAAAVFNWSETDGYKNAGNAYTPPSGPGLWKPTPPTNTAAASPYWGNNRPVVTGSLDNSQPAAPPAYSEVPGSAFHNMAKELYDISQTLTDDQKAMAFFWRDIPGVSSPGHWLSILQQVLHKKETKLDKVALSYALTGAAINDALISCWKAKYQHNLLRPITYIRDIMGHGGWNTVVGTPAHPEYPSAHSALSGAAAEVLEKLFGNIGSFTDHTYDYMGFASRNYSSFTAIAVEASKSRLYGGIHFQPSLDAGLQQGKKVAGNILYKSAK